MADMIMRTFNASRESSVESRAQALLTEHRRKIFRQTDRLFVGLMIFQWIGGIILALVVSPKTWIGAQSQTHIHVWAAIVLGGGIAAAPVALGIVMPGETITRYVIGISQMLFSALLIHLTGGRIETHFHVFGSLAFLAFYRDWKVLVPATIVVAVDHMLRGIFWPQSVFGVLTTSSWRWVEHTAWVLFEDIFLFVSCQRSVREMGDIAERTAQLEAYNQSIEVKVNERTRELIKTQNDLKQASRLADIGTLAASVAHELRNPLAVIQLSTHNLKREKDGLSSNWHLVNIEKKVWEGNQIIDNLLNYARIKIPNCERVDLKEILDECIYAAQGRFRDKGIIIEKRFGPVGDINADANQIREICMNVLNNACQAFIKPEGKVEVTAEGHGDMIKVTIKDNGIGIPEEDLSKIFNPFFTRKSKGTGLGLTICNELIHLNQGRIEINSQPGQGTSIMVFLPVYKEK
jgi:signal transduction histidine kinase